MAGASEKTEETQKVSYGKDAPPPMWDGSSPHVEFPRYERDVKLWCFETETEDKKKGVRRWQPVSPVHPSNCS